MDENSQATSVLQALDAGHLWWGGVLRFLNDRTEASWTAIGSRLSDRSRPTENDRTAQHDLTRDRIYAVVCKRLLTDPLLITSSRPDHPTSSIGTD